MWSVEVGGQISDAAWPTNYKEPSVTSVIVADVEDRENGAASLFKTEGG